LALFTLLLFFLTGGTSGSFGLRFNPFLGGCFGKTPIVPPETNTLEVAPVPEQDGTSDESLSITIV
jgi:hypothetical protein